jgi:hypothetical protein
MPTNNEFRPGQKVEISGIYIVTHDSHALPHEVTCVAGKTFPPCNACGNHPRFKLVRPAEHIEAHSSFQQLLAARRYHPT